MTLSRYPKNDIIKLENNPVTLACYVFSCLWISRIEEVKKKLEDEDKRNEASGGIADGSGAGGVSGGDGGDMEVETWTTGTGEEPDNPFSKRSTKQKGHGKSKVTFENFEYIKVLNQESVCFSCQFSTKRILLVSSGSGKRHFRQSRSVQGKSHQISVRDENP